jgi:adenosylcobinamide-GDP ribazoletransferase
VTHEWRLFLVALQFLTRLPVPSLDAFEPAWLQASARYFAAVGSLVGALMAATLVVAATLWPLPVAVLLAVTAGALVTGAFHEDGLADTWDALGGHAPRERALEIMKDSRLGTYGVLALLSVQAMKAALLWALADASLTIAATCLVLAHGAARAGTVALIHALPYGGDEAHAKAKPLARQVPASSVVWALVTIAAVALAVVAAGMSPVVVGAAWLGAGVAAWATGCWLRRRLGGYTGDGLGAAEQHAECAALLLAAAAVLPLPLA